MTQARLLLAAGLALAAAAFLPASSRGQGPFQIPEGLLGASATLSPRIVLFGDTVRARIDLVVDREAIDPDSVRIEVAFSPWETVGQPQPTRRDSGTTTHLRTTWILRCLTSPCVPGGQSSALELDPAQVSFAAPGAGPNEREAIPIPPWPLMTVYSRFASSSAEQASSTPWRADLVTMPAVSHRIAPGVLLAIALAGGALGTLGALALLYAARPRRKPAPPPEPEPEPLPQLTPLEQALVLLEDSAREDGAEDRRRALELVAEVLEESGDYSDLVRSARVLAWSEDDPAVEQTSGLAAQVRPLVEEERAAEEAEASEESEHVV